MIEIEGVENWRVGDWFKGEYEDDNDEDSVWRKFEGELYRYHQGDWVVGDSWVAYGDRDSRDEALWWTIRPGFKLTSVQRTPPPLPTEAGSLIWNPSTWYGNHFEGPYMLNESDEWWGGVGDFGFLRSVDIISFDLTPEG